MFREQRVAIIVAVICCAGGPGLFMAEAARAGWKNARLLQDPRESSSPAQVAMDNLGNALAVWEQWGDRNPVIVVNISKQAPA